MSLLRGSHLTRGNTQLTEGANLPGDFTKDTTEKGLTSILQSVNIQQQPRQQRLVEKDAGLKMDRYDIVFIGQMGMGTIIPFEGSPFVELGSPVLFCCDSSLLSAEKDCRSDDNLRE
ncbi:MAG: hypothetical protein MZV70_08200 [Desulfobacterales bacterium]|nr:hypothetical protein [Desulfobacterales bacterium]